MYWHLLSLAYITEESDDPNNPLIAWMSKGGSSSGGTVANIGLNYMGVPHLSKQWCQMLIKGGSFIAHTSCGWKNKWRSFPPLVSAAGRPTSSRDCASCVHCSRCLVRLEGRGGWKLSFQSRSSETYHPRLHWLTHPTLHHPGWGNIELVVTGCSSGSTHTSLHTSVSRDAVMFGSHCVWAMESHPLNRRVHAPHWNCYHIHISWK